MNMHGTTWKINETLDNQTIPHLQVHAVIGVLTDDTDPMVSVMKLEKAPQETYADIGGLDTQIQEIKASGNLYQLVSHDIT